MLKSLVSILLHSQVFFDRLAEIINLVVVRMKKISPAVLLVLLIIPATSCSTTGESTESESTEADENGCICTMQYDPVCGSDGKTYGNACVAECEGMTDYTMGECDGE